VLVDDLVFGSAGDGNIYAFDAATGTMRWALPRLSGPLGGVITATDIDHRAITRAGRLIVAGSATGYVVAYDVDTRLERWRFSDPAAGSTTFALSADDGHVYVPFFGGFIVSLDVASGAEHWRYGDFTQGFIWPPVPAGDRVYASAARAGFFALPNRTPEPHP
jgi:outer membrane protein assembly factor BamB